MSLLNAFNAKLDKLLSIDQRYREEAYLFVMKALSRAVSQLPQKRHISGQELLNSLKDEAKEQFGPMAPTVLQYWGIQSSSDFGNIVFSMVEEGILVKTESDSIEDFKDYDFFDQLFDVTKEYQLKDT